MKLSMISAAALCAVAQPVLAHNGEDHGALPRADDHGPAGVMGDHIHKKGEVMIGLEVSRDWYGGDNLSGTQALSDLDIANAGYAMKATSMTMDMAMLHIMYAPSDKLTLMVMPMWMRMNMVMEGLPMVPANMGSEHGGHSMMPGMTHEHSVSGVSDTQVGALYSLTRKPGFKAQAGLMISIPTGSVSHKNEDGTFVHYGMQSGSGTWDVIPSLTVTGGTGPVHAGVQTRYVWRTDDSNASGFAFGDRFEATGWTSYAPSRDLSLSVRLIYANEGPVLGHYNAGHNHAAPPDRQANYGGDTLDVGLGVNLLTIGGPLKGVRLGAEARIPVYQRLNGIQLQREGGLSLSLSKAF